VIDLATAPHGTLLLRLCFAVMLAAYALLKWDVYMPPSRWFRSFPGTSNRARLAVSARNFVRFYAAPDCLRRCRTVQRRFRDRWTDTLITTRSRWKSL
jgi:hypothetical protein